ncbi:CinA-like protein [Spathaspora sp. JA1]|nr:CinA-like protein [Spathaspora sp. JA1]
MSFPPEDISQIVTQIATILRERNQTLAISEAACGGLISAYIVSVPGASNFYIGGKLVYSLKQRLKLSGWTDLEISNYMGPSEQVALKLARTAKYELGSTYVLSETGFAGPSTSIPNGNDKEEQDGNDDNEVGTVYIGLSGPTGDASTSKRTGSLDRAKNMTEFAKLGLSFLLEQLQKSEKSQ